MQREVLYSLEKMPLDQAREVATDMLNTPKPGGKQPTLKQKIVVNRLIYDVSVARTSQEVMRIMWQVYMSSSGFGISDSAWKKHYNNV